MADVARLSADMYRQAEVVAELPRSLLAVETAREAATMVMLVSVALLAARNLLERVALFCWVFAAWDICYYAGLWTTVRWPSRVISIVVQPSGLAGGLANAFDIE